MEEQTTWKGHAFTLLVFTAIVVLCSIFFMLGMIVDRTQAKRISSASALGGVPKSQTKAVMEDKTDFTFYESVKKGPPQPEPPVTETAKKTLQADTEAPLELRPETSDAPALPPASAPPVLASPPAETRPGIAAANMLQLGIFSKSANADKLLDAVKKIGFRAFILGPAEKDANPVFKVQVGPFKGIIEAQQAKKKLEAAGYKPIPIPILKK